MAVTRSTVAERRQTPRGAISWRRAEALWLLAGSLVLAFGFYLVYAAKSRSFQEIETGLSNHTILDLNALDSQEQLLPFLGIFTDPAERRFAARKIYDASGGLGNVGALARIHVTDAEIQRTRGLKSFRDRHATLLLTGEQFRELKPSFVVRRPAHFHRAFLLWTDIFLPGF